MRCKKHLPDLTSTIGVCASCLRERLHPIYAAQVQAQAQSGENASPQRQRNPKEEDKPAPINFPRSVSPYVARRKSDCDTSRERLFYGTPQAKPAARDGGDVPEKRRHGGGRFWMLSNIFRGRSHKTETARREPCEERSTGSSWFTTMLHARHHKGGESDRRRFRRADRGMSPSTAADFSDEAAQERSDSGNSTECSPQKQNPTPATAHRRSRMGAGGGGKGLSTSMAFCLSPLVRASPNQHWTHNNNNTNNSKGLGQEMGAGGPHHISSAASFCANRSRKLADFGRNPHNR
ncbi:uncharacterized protein LOC106773777 [Vigna radiata var. radiata]|uniref:Uncharacterized protein LOC106773777 n=1 Tax=Vigna radiata var. radiata TaxID=3916 RepID=A0A1S3VCD1_VIGRR|nr:uncharacterized protein LOC106773777 [Vigna radiata var. radiata]